MAKVTWVSPTSGSFENAGNWSTHQVPSGSSDVFITSAITVSTTNDETINSLTTSSRATLNIGATTGFTINGVPDVVTGSSSNAGTINLAGNGDLFLNGSFNNSGRLVSQANSDVWVTGTLTNTGSVSQSGDLHLGNPTTAGAAINGAGASYSMQGAVDIIPNGGGASSFTNNGTFVRTGTGSSDVSVAFVNHKNVSVGSGGMHFLSSLTNTGTMTATGALLQIQTGITGTGALDVGSGGTVLLNAGADAGQTLDFLAGSGALDLATPAAFAGTIEGFKHGNLIDLQGKPFTSFTTEKFANGTLTVKNGATTVASLHFAGSYTTASFHLSSDGHSGTLISHV
jgi:hypothetical protein